MNSTQQSTHNWEHQHFYVEILNQRKQDKTLIALITQNWWPCDTMKNRMDSKRNTTFMKWKNDGQKFRSALFWCGEGESKFYRRLKHPQASWMKTFTTKGLNIKRTCVFSYSLWWACFAYFMAVDFISMPTFLLICGKPSQLKCIFLDKCSLMFWFRVQLQLFFSYFGRGAVLEV